MDEEQRPDVMDASEQVRTGEDRVDSVIASIEELQRRPVEEHVAGFEEAHERLRAALDAMPHVSTDLSTGTDTGTHTGPHTGA